MFSGFHGPCRLQKLAFRTIGLQTGELSGLLNITSHLVELDVDQAVPIYSGLFTAISHSTNTSCSLYRRRCLQVCISIPLANPMTFDRLFHACRMQISLKPTHSTHPLSQLGSFRLWMAHLSEATAGFLIGVGQVLAIRLRMKS
jgi:hypothetical protein